MRKRSLNKFWIRLGGLVNETIEISLTLFKVMIPVLLLVKLFQELGAVRWIDHLLQPAMMLVGLPESMGLVWATTLLTNIYAGMVVYFNLMGSEPLSVAQVTILGGMMLIAHTLPVEARIAQKAGVRLPATLVVRLCGALLFGSLLNLLYQWGGWFDQPATMLWVPEMESATLWQWGFSQLKSFALIIVLIFLLLTLLTSLRALKIEALMIRLLQPMLRLMGIGASATSITIIGMTLGLALGGGLLIRESRDGGLNPRDIFASMSLLALCHSLIEDTLLILLLGADLTGILWLRLLFSLIAVGMLARIAMRMSDQLLYRFLVCRNPGN